MPVNVVWWPVGHDQSTWHWRPWQAAGVAPAAALRHGRGNRDARLGHHQAGRVHVSRPLGGLRAAVGVARIRACRRVRLNANPAAAERRAREALRVRRVAQARAPDAVLARGVALRARDVIAELVDHVAAGDGLPGCAARAAGLPRPAHSGGAAGASAAAPDAGAVVQSVGAAGSGDDADPGDGEYPHDAELPLGAGARKGHGGAR